MMKFRNILLVTLILSFLSCRNELGQCVGVINIDHASIVDSVAFSKYFESPLVIPLETKPNCIIRGIYRLDMFENHIYILDVISNRLVVFNIDGHYLFDVGRQGNGNGEYLEISDFSIDRKNKLVYVWDEGKRCALRYNAMSGRYVSKITPSVGDSPCYDMLFSHGKIYLNQASNSSEGYMIKEIDELSGKTEGTYVDAATYNKGWNLPLRNKNSGFSVRSTSTPKYVGLFCDIIVAITENDIKPIYQLKGEKFANKDDIKYVIQQYKQTGTYNLDVLNQNNKIYGIFNYLEFGNIVHFSFHKGNEIQTLLYDSSTHSSIIPTSFGDDYLLNGDFCYLELYHSDSTKVVAVLQTDVIPMFVNYAIKSGKLNRKIDNYDALCNLSENVENNPILFVYRIK